MRRSGSRPGWIPVHPRACGEHGSTSGTVRVVAGSFPRVRGTLERPLDGIVGGRFIPARAGNMSGFRTAEWLRSVHPRACGEHPNAQPDVPTVSGSSPRVRGTWRFSNPTQQYHRFIPARAGNIERIAVADRHASVHPRACGEHERTLRNPDGVTGSSPRVRGTFSVARLLLVPLRFIPARAGNIIIFDN